MKIVKEWLEFIILLVQLFKEWKVIKNWTIKFFKKTKCFLKNWVK